MALAAKKTSPGCFGVPESTKTGFNLHSVGPASGFLLVSLSKVPR